jgi:GDP/UDP-N,N'-diacetylbacillosamine 2-epimerase (hydrolysing)
MANGRVRKVLYVTGTRADFGLMNQTLEAIESTPSLALEIVASGMHVMPEFGMTVEEVRADHPNVHVINADYSTDDRESAALFVGAFIQGLTHTIKETSADVVLLLGDRAEMLAGAVVATYLGVPIAHVHGGDVSSTVDEHVRHAITKLAHIHFPATQKSAQRLAKMGEEAWRIHCVGSPAIDAIRYGRFIDPNEIARLYDLDLSKPIILVIQHPVSGEVDDAPLQLQATLDAIVQLKHQTIVIFPNADAGGRAMIHVLEQYRSYAFIRAFETVPRAHYLSLMNVVSVLVGNSSSGIIESPLFHLPSVNVGTRQRGRECASNIINVDYDTSQIIAAIKTALEDAMFREMVNRCKNPYGDGTASARIVDVLREVEIDARLLQKHMTY